MFTGFIKIPDAPMAHTNEMHGYRFIEVVLLLVELCSKLLKFRQSLLRPLLEAQPLGLQHVGQPEHLLEHRVRHRLVGRH